MTEAVIANDALKISDAQQGEASALSAHARRIAIIDHTAKMGGGEVALLNLVAEIDSEAFDIVVILFSDGPLRERLESAGSRVKICPLELSVLNARKDGLGAGSLLKVIAALRTAIFVRRLARMLREERVELVHTNSLKADVLGGVAGKLARLPVVWHIRDRIANDYLPPVVASLFRIACKYIPDYVIANSHATMHTLGQAIKGRGSVIASGYRDRYTTVIHDGTEVVGTGNEIYLVNAAPVIGIVGRLTEWKGQHIFLDAAASVLRQYHTAKFKLIGAALFGEEDYERQLQEQVIRLGIQTSVELCGFCSDVSERIAGLDILVHASITGEPFGQVVIEGMAASKPVIATNGGGIPEIVIDGVTGLLVPMGDAAAMAEAICELLQDPSRRKIMGKIAREHVMAHFTIERVARNVEQVYNEMLTTTRPRSRRGKI